MFFSLERSTNPRFSANFMLGRLVLNTDAGWHSLDLGDRILVFKGYIDSLKLDEHVATIEDHGHSGNYCVFDYHRPSGSIKIKTNLYRGFTMWHDDVALTNFTPGGYTIWADSTVSVDQDLGLHEQKIDVIGEIDISEISRDELVDWVHERLTRRVRDFVRNNTLPLRVFLSGGIDSMLVFSYIQAATDEFEIMFENHVDWDKFWCQNQKHIKEHFWGYQQIHHWRDASILSSGAPGDEFMLRSPVTSNLWLKHHGTDIPREMSRYNTGNQQLHHDYFNLPKHLKIFSQQDSDPPIENKADLYHHLCDLVVNDCQHWHLGNTLTFTPLRDLEIFKMFLRLPLIDGLQQIMDSAISRELISRNDVSLLDYLSDVKNTGENLSNLVGLMSKHLAVSGQ